MARPTRTARVYREPKVVRSDLRGLIEHAMEERPYHPGMDIHVIAERAGLSKRTVYRALERGEDPPRPTMELDTADRLLLAIGRDLSEVRLVEDDHA